MGRKIVLMHADCSPEQVLQHAGKKGMKWDMEKHYEKYPNARAKNNSVESIKRTATRSKNREDARRTKEEVFLEEVINKGNTNRQRADGVERTNRRRLSTMSDRYRDGY